MTHLANSLPFWPPHRPHACGRHTVQEWTSGSGTQDAGAACRRRWETGGERRTSGKRSEIRAVGTSLLFPTSPLVPPPGGGETDRSHFGSIILCLRGPSPWVASPMAASSRLPFLSLGSLARRGPCGVVPGKGRDGQGGRAPKCKTVCQVGHFGGHFGRWILMTFDDSFKEIKKKWVSKVVKRVRQRARAARAARVLSIGPLS